MSNLPFAAKIVEKAVILQILGHCEKHGQPSTNLSSYQQYHSTETALLQVHNNILMNMDKQEITLLVLVYFNSAFDTIYYSTTVTSSRMTLESLVLLPLGLCLFYLQDNMSLLTMRSPGISLSWSNTLHPLCLMSFPHCQKVSTNCQELC